MFEIGTVYEVNPDYNIEKPQGTFTLCGYVYYENKLYYIGVNKKFEERESYYKHCKELP